MVLASLAVMLAMPGLAMAQGAVQGAAQGVVQDLVQGIVQGAALGASASASSGTSQGTPRSSSNPETAPAFEVTPFIGQMAGGEFEDPLDGRDRDLDADTNWGIILNALASPGRHYELLYTRQSTELEGESRLDMDVHYLQIGGTVSYLDAQRVIPYFGLTVGAAQFEPGSAGMDDETKFAFSVATGVRVPINDRVGVRLDLRAFVTLLGGDEDIFCVSSGGASCRVRVKSDTLTQYAASLGVAIRF